jgi:hypothetical protein
VEGDEENIMINAESGGGVEGWEGVEGDEENIMINAESGGWGGVGGWGGMRRTS